MGYVDRDSSEQLCQEYRAGISHRIETLADDVEDLKLDQRTLYVKVTSLEISQGRFEEQISRVISKLDELANAIRWLGGIMITGMVAIIVYALQQVLF